MRFTKVVLICFFTITVFLPLLAILSKIDMYSIYDILSSDQFQEAVINSITVSFCSTLVSVLIAWLLAFAINRSNIPFKNIVSILITLPMLIPSISHGIGLVNIFGDNGIFTKLVGININLYGFNGIFLGSILYSFPVAFLILTDAMKYADNTLYEVADVLGIIKTKKFLAITMQYMKLPLISTIFAVFTMIFTDYGIPLSVGGRYITLPFYLYREVIGLLDFSKGAFIGIILLMPAIIAFIIDLCKKDNSIMGLNVKKIIIKENKARDIFLGIFCVIIISFVISILFSFVIMTLIKKYPYDLSFTLNHIKHVINQGLGNYLSNSIYISFLVAIIGTIIGYITAYITARTKNNVRTKFLHLISISSLAIPGIVLGLGYIIFFNRSFIYGTILILVLVNIIHFFSSPYLIAYNSMKKLNCNFENVAKTLNINTIRLIKDIFIPNTLDTISEMFGYFFVNSMITISAIAFLYNTKTMPLSIMINQLEGSMMFEAAAFVSLIILVSNIIVKTIVVKIKKYYEIQCDK